MTESENRRCAVVTGSTRGIGRAVARELAAAGMNVVVNSSSGRSLPAAEAVAAEIAEEFGVETLAVAANVADAAEAEANRIVWADLPVQAEYPAPEVLATLTYRSKKAIDGAVRIVTIPGADCCACCGTHVERTGQIGQIKVMGAMNYKGGTRITLACGGRALTAFSRMLEEQAKLRAQFSAKNGQLAAAAQRQADELAAQKARAAQLEQQVFAYTAAQVQEGDQPVLFVRDLSGDSLRRLCLALSEHTHRPCAVFTQGGQGYAYCLAWNGGDARVLAKAMNAALNGRGGGKPELCSGSVAETDLDKVTAFFQEQEQAGNI